MGDKIIGSAAFVSAGGPPKTRNDSWFSLLVTARSSTCGDSPREGEARSGTSRSPVSCGHRAGRGSAPQEPAARSVLMATASPAASYTMDESVEMVETPVIMSTADPGSGRRGVLATWPGLTRSAHAESAAA